MRYYDCVTFFNENDLLWLRLNELKPLNPIHVIVEAAYTHTGEPKLFNFDAERFKGFDIRYLQLHDLPNNGNAWDNENYQRDRIKDYLRDCMPKDKIFIGDLDEIPRPEAVNYYDSRMGVAGLCMDKYSCYMNLLEGVQNWSVGKLCTWEILRQTTPNKLRNSGANFIINYAGWHISFLGGVEKMKEKLFAYAHTETVTGDLLSNLEYKFATGQSLWGKDFWKFVDIDETFPKYLQEHKEEFKEYIKEI